MSKIHTIHAHEILDSRGNPTVKVSVLLSNGVVGSASVPSGASTGVHEAHELRDGNPDRYFGKGVLKACRNVNTTIARALQGVSIKSQAEIDRRLIELDGSPNKARLGANALLGVSLACAHAGAKAAKKPLFVYLREQYTISEKRYKLPIATMNVLNGGAHAGWLLDFQEYMIVPRQRSFKERLRCGAEVFHVLGGLLKEKGYSTLKGDEGGFAAPLKNNEEAFKLIMKAIDQAGYESGREVGLAMDPAVSEIYDAKTETYNLRADKKKLNRAQMIGLWKTWLKKYPILSIEDGLDQDDWEGWTEMTRTLGSLTTLVGDDFLVTNTDRLSRAIEEKAGNAILIKVNQIGTLSEAVDAIMLAKKHTYKVSVSHRSGETADTTIADLAVAVNAEFIKTGSLSRSERLAKYNRLIEIEEEVRHL